MNSLCKKILFVSYTLGVLCVVACGKEAKVNTEPTNQAGEDFPLPTSNLEQDLTPTPLTRPISRRTPTPRSKPTVTPTPLPTSTPMPIPTSFLNPELSYLEISVNKGDIMVYLSEDPMKPEVLVGKAGGKFHSFSWNYNLDYGTPVIDIESEKEVLEKFGFSDQEELLIIWLPVEPLAEQHFPSYFDKAGTICGEGHCLSLTALSDPDSNMMQDRLLDAPAYAESVGKFTMGYAKDKEGEEQLTLFSEQGDILKQYPMLCLPKGDYPVIYETPHISYAKHYQRFGIAVEGVNLWLGQQTDGSLWVSREKGIGYDIRYSPYLKKWWPRELGEENSEILLDLDGDGSCEQIIWHIEEKGKEKETRVTINGVDYPLICPEWGDITPVLTISLDGKTNQLVVIDYAYGTMANFIVFGYRDGKVYEVGTFFNMEYWKKKSKEENVYISHALCYPLQEAQVWVEQKFVDGVLKEIPQDYYEFVEDATTWKQPILTGKKTIELYQERGGDGTVLLTKEGHARMIGTDLKEWVLLENVDTGEKGWLHIPMQERSGKICILPDGTQVHGAEIFEGLANAG